MNPLNLPALPMGSTLLHASGGLRCHLGFYRAGSSQPLHTHTTPTVSLVLSGTVHEEVLGHEVAAGPASISIKPADVRHRNVYGRNGAVILSVLIDDPVLWAEVVSPSEWAWQRLPDVHAALASLAAPGGLKEGTLESLALAGGESRPTGIPPRWLRVVHDELCDQPERPLSAIAAAAGVHPVSLARAFRRWYGMTPSAFRLSQRTSSAIGAALWSGKAASHIAHDAGFADQSHMARSIRAATGHSLSQLRRMALKSLSA